MAARPPTSATLTLRQLNRATLARQMLLAREKTTALSAIEQLGGLQAQLAKPPFAGLWSRVQGFERVDLIALLHTRAVVRATAMRGTIHLMTAKDYLRLRASLQPMLTRATASVLRERISELPLDAVVDVARAHFGKTPCTFDVMREILARHFPKVDDRALGYAVRMHLPLVQVPTDATWGYPAAADFAVAESWLKKAPAVDVNPAPLVLRYLGAFGPASVADAQTWSGLQGLAPTFETLRPKLAVFRDERNRELFDLPDAPRPSGDVPAPVRFAADFDNIVLGHADRTRVIADEHRKAIATKNLQVLATVLVDGFVAGTWKVERKRKVAALSVAPFVPFSKAVRDALTAEGLPLLRFLEADALEFEVRFTPR